MTTNLRHNYVVIERNQTITPSSGSMGKSSDLELVVIISSTANSMHSISGSIYFFISCTSFDYCFSLINPVIYSVSSKCGYRNGKSSTGSSGSGGTISLLPVPEGLGNSLSGRERYIHVSHNTDAVANIHTRHR